MDKHSQRFIPRFTKLRIRRIGIGDRRRRYSPALQQQALADWQQRRDQEGVRTIAAALGHAGAS